MPIIKIPINTIFINAYARVYDPGDKYTIRTPLSAYNTSGILAVEFPTDYPREKKGTIWIECLIRNL